MWRRKGFPAEDIISQEADQANGQHLSRAIDSKRNRDMAISLARRHEE
jgi:hypothetical protein